MSAAPTSDERGAAPATRPAARSRRAVVAGGGLAGMAAAVALESCGWDVTLLEARDALGGRAGSFREPQTGEELDNRQHVLLGCCSNLRDFYRRLGVLHLIRFERTVRFIDESGRGSALRGVRGLPAPLHLGPSMARFSALSFGEKLAASRAMLAMLRLGKAGRAKLADVSFGEWLDDHHQPAELVRKLYDPILTGALNEDCRLASAAYAIQVFQDALLANAQGYVVGLPDCPLGKLYERIPCRDVRLGARVSHVLFEQRAAAGVALQTGEALRADAVVLATNYHAVQRWVPPELAATDERFAHLDRLQSVPILGAHLWFDRPILAESHVAFIGGPLQWLFRKDADGRAVHGVISAARAWANRPRAECLDAFERQVRATIPAAREAKLLRGVIVVEKRATFSPSPGVDRFRPHQAPPPDGIRNLYLAGDYTLTGWPATMEGAVRSGYLAADAVARTVASGGSPDASFVVPDLPVQWPARLLGL